MAYWVKPYDSWDHTYTPNGQRVEYRIKRFSGPFRFLEDAEAEITEEGDWEIIEFDC